GRQGEPPDGPLAAARAEGDEGRCHAPGRRRPGRALDRRGHVRAGEVILSEPEASATDQVEKTPVADASGSEISPTVERIRQRPVCRGSQGDAMPDAVEIDHVTKSFGDFVAVNDLSLRIPTDTIYGFIGPNGSGKTTTLRMIMRIYLPDPGG